MKYQIEKDWTTEAGLRAVVIAMPMGHRCGYVAVPKDNPFYGFGYDDVELNEGVHGGLTFASKGLGVGDESMQAAAGMWWFGFDCAHYDDKKDWSIMDEIHKEVYRTLIDLEFENSTIKDTAFCVAECESLAKQLAGE